MAQIQPRGKAQNKRFQFNAPADIIDEFTAKKEILAQHDLTVDLTEDFIKVLRDAIKAIDKRLIEVKENQSDENKSGGNTQASM